jgi:hypothetical protein
MSENKPLENAATIGPSALALGKDENGALVGWWLAKANLSAL